MPTHYIITNREIINEHRKNEFVRRDGKEEARDELRFGEYTFSDSNDEGAIDLYKDLTVDQKEKYRDFNKLPVGYEFGSIRVFNSLYGDMLSSHGDTLVFIHGFKSDLDNALMTVRRLHYEYVENQNSRVKNIVLFTWPARSNLLKYRDDARDARISGYALGRGFKLFHDFLIEKFGQDPSNPKNEPCDCSIHLMVHSMGNQVLEAMLQWLYRRESTRIPSLFNEVVLVGADIDYDALEEPKPLYHLIDICQRVHVYYHNRDLALQVSKRTKNAFNRLGLTGTKKKDRLPDNVLEKDVSQTNEDKGLMEKIVNHWYYYNTQEVVSDIVGVLNGTASKF